MSSNNEYIYKGLESLSRINSEIENNTNIQIKLLCYNINTQGVFPFMQFLLWSYGVIPCLNSMPEKLICPLLNNNTNFNDYIVELIYIYLSDIDSEFDINTINISGFYDYNSIRYIFVDISKINMESSLLTKYSKTWMTLPSEIINNRHICNISIEDEINDFFINNPIFYTLYNIDTGKAYPIPEIIYQGACFKKTEFQSVFGVSKMDKQYGNHYYFKSSFANALKEGAWNKDSKPEYKYDKLITDNEYGRYIKGGINRIALLLNNTKHITLSNEIVDVESELEMYDSVILYSDEEPLILVKDYNQQVGLSYHKIDKRTLGETWNIKNSYSIE
jgi:hypothetical protein